MSHERAVTKKRKPRKPLASHRWLPVAQERILAGEPEATVLADYGYVPASKPLAQFEAWAVVDGKFDSIKGMCFYSKKVATWVVQDFGGKPIRVRVTVEEI